MSKDWYLRGLYYFKAFGYKFIDSNLNQEVVQNINLQDQILQIRNCNLCELGKSKKYSFCGIGNQNAKVIFVIDAPSNSDDDNGVLFSGGVGEKFYELILLGARLRKSDIFITSLLRCKPTTTQNIDLCFKLCEPYLKNEFKIIKPYVIVALGEDVFERLSGVAVANYEAIRGNVMKFQNTLLMPTFSPYFIIKNPSKQDAFLQDLTKIRRYL